MTDVMRFGEVLEAADRLSYDEQQELVAILNRRLAHAAAPAIGGRGSGSSRGIRGRWLFVVFSR